MIEPRLEEVKIVVFGKVSTWESVSQSCSRWEKEKGEVDACLCQRHQLDVNNKPSQMEIEFILPIPFG